MQKIKKLFIALTLFVLLPLTLLWVVFSAWDKNTDWLELATSEINKNLSPALLFNIHQLVDKAKGPYTTSDLDSESVEESIPLIKSQAENKTSDGSVMMEDFVNDIQKENTTEDINKIPLEYFDTHLTQEDILNDKLSRLPDEFKVREKLKNRIGFWLNIYSKYSSRFSLIHDEDSPWIVYHVVDARDIFSQPGSLVTKNMNEQKLISNEKKKILKILKRLTVKKKKFSEEENAILKILPDHPKDYTFAAKIALNKVRVQRGQKNFFKSGLVQGSKYIHEMEAIFAKYDLPTELVRLPLVESSFNENAVSKVGASGIWQFMPAVGKYYLKMGGQYDERNSPIKATEAAARLLKSNFNALKDWALAITAYNHGASGIIKAVKKIKSQDIEDIVSKYRSKSFSFASQNFYSEFMAALYAERYQDEIFGLIPKPPPLAEDRVKLKRKLYIRDIAEISGVTMEEVKLHNTDLKSRGLKENILLPKGYIIHLPLGHGAPLELYFQK